MPGLPLRGRNPGTRCLLPNCSTSWSDPITSDRSQAIWRALPFPWPECKPIVFLSHPIKRARSVFNFVRADPTQPNSEIARVRGFAGYVRWALEGGDGGVVIRNYQVVHLSAASVRNGSVHQANATDPDLAEACSLIDNWGVIGLVDCFDASAKLIQKLYSSTFPDLRFDRYWLDEEEVSPQGRVSGTRRNPD